MMGTREISHLQYVIKLKSQRFEFCNLYLYCKRLTMSFTLKHAQEKGKGIMTNEEESKIEME